jgi:hypothetical protein
MAGTCLNAGLNSLLAPTTADDDSSVCVSAFVGKKLASAVGCSNEDYYQRFR